MLKEFTGVKTDSNNNNKKRFVRLVNTLLGFMLSLPRTVHYLQCSARSCLFIDPFGDNCLEHMGKRVMGKEFYYRCLIYI